LISPISYPWIREDIYVDKAAEELHKNIGKVLPPPEDGLVEEWSAWPYLRIELPRSDVDKIEQASESERVKLAPQIVRDYGVVVGSNEHTARLFGRIDFPREMKFEVLLNAWKSKYPDAEATWFDSCCNQIMMGAARGFPVIHWTPMREVVGDSEFIPVLSRIKRVSFRGSVQFDLYFYNLSESGRRPEMAEAVALAARALSKIHLVDCSITPTSLGRGESISITYKVASNCRSPIAVWLGADCGHLYNPEQDIEVSVPFGVHEFQRRLTVGDEWPKGHHELGIGIWIGVKSVPEQSLCLAAKRPAAPIEVL
jgi:hypothetical protein